MRIIHGFYWLIVWLSLKRSRSYYFNRVGNIIASQRYGVGSSQVYDENCYQLTRAWVSKWIIAKSFCPWASSVYVEKRIKYVLCHDAINSTAGYLNLHKKIMDEVDALSSISSTNDNVTTLIVLPNARSFARFVELCHAINYSIENDGYERFVQTASFHPEYVFEGTTECDVENYTNRSPFPIVHLLRVEDVASAVDQVGGDTDFVWKNNIAKLKAEGIGRVEESFRQMIDNGA